MLGTHLKGTVSFQGRLGANSHQACIQFCPHLDVMPCSFVDDALYACEKGNADMVMLPVDNLLGGRVADVHRLLPDTQLFIVGEAFLPIHHCLLGVKGVKIDEITTVASHPQALAQCRQALHRHHWVPQEYSDTAGAAQWVSQVCDHSIAAIASRAAADIYGLEVIREHLEDNPQNATRFWAFAREPLVWSTPQNHDVTTALYFQAQSIPAALYKCLGGFATQGINLSRLESYTTPFKPNFSSFLIEAQIHENDSRMRQALLELSYFSEKIKVLGTYSNAYFNP